MATPRKVIMAIYCDNDEQAIALQNIAKELCSEFSIQAVDVLAMYPMIRKNKKLLKDAVKTIGKEGKAGAIRLIPALIKALM